MQGGLGLQGIEFALLLGFAREVFGLGQRADLAELAEHGAHIELAPMLGRVVLSGGKGDELSGQVSKGYLHVQGVRLAGVGDDVFGGDDLHQAILIQSVMRVSKGPPEPKE
ncbi:hypothetical protein D3C72_1562280 [compost metagenome]